MRSTLHVYNVGFLFLGLIHCMIVQYDWLNAQCSSAVVSWLAYFISHNMNTSYLTHQALLSLVVSRGTLPEQITQGHYFSSSWDMPEGFCGFSIPILPISPSINSSIAFSSSGLTIPGLRVTACVRCLNSSIEERSNAQEMPPTNMTPKLMTLSVASPRACTASKDLSPESNLT